MKRILHKILGKEKSVLNRAQQERIQFSKGVRKQLEQLKEKGLSIPVCTLERPFTWWNKNRTEGPAFAERSFSRAKQKS